MLRWMFFGFRIGRAAAFVASVIFIALPAGSAPIPVSFLYQDDVARSVSLAGTFNAWSPDRLPFHKSGSETWTCTVMLEPGRYEYKFVLDGRRYINDPWNPRVASVNTNSVLRFSTEEDLPLNFTRRVVRHEFVLPDRDAARVSVSGEFARWNNEQYPLRRDAASATWRGVYYVPPGPTDLGVIRDGEWSSPEIGSDPRKYFVEFRDESRYRIDPGRFVSPLFLASDRIEMLFTLRPPNGSFESLRGFQVKAFRDNRPADAAFDASTGEIRIPLTGITEPTSLAVYAERDGWRAVPAVIHILPDGASAAVVPIIQVAGTAYPDEALTLDARRSHASGVPIVAYRWSVEGGGTVAGPGSAITTFTATDAGRYRLRLDVTDAEGRTAFDVMPLEIAAPPAGVRKHRFSVSERDLRVPGNVRSVAVAGSFNAWSKTALSLKRLPDGTWEANTWMTVGEHEYKFVVNETEWLADPHNSHQRGAYGNSVLIVADPSGVVIPPAASISPAARDAVIYQVIVPRFCDSDGDGIGDLAGLASKLDYIRDLGVNWIYLLPIFHSPNQHGYTTTDYYTIDPELGSIEDFDALIAAAHARGLKVMLDYVFNHSSADHPFFVHAMSRPHSPWRRWHKWTGERTWEGFGGTNTTLPGWNFDHPEVRRYGIDVSLFWLGRGVDGFRCDVAHAVPDDFWHEWSAELKAARPDVLLFPEFNEPYFDLYYDFASTKIFEVFPDRRIDALDEMLNMDAGGGRVAVRFLDYHDRDRALSAFGADRTRARLGAVLLLTSPGVPMIYYGAEAGMEGFMANNTNREMMEWAFPDLEMREHYRGLIRLRREHESLQSGSIRRLLVDGSDRVYAYLRQSGEDRVVVLLNFRDRSVPVKIDLGRIGVAFRSVRPLFGRVEATAGDGKITARLEAWEGAILRLE